MLIASHRPWFSFVLAMVWMAGIGGPTSAGESVLAITPETSSYLNQYLHTRKPLAFAVSADGTRSGYVYCEDYHCRNENYRNRALGLCAQVGGKDCKILAVGQDIKLTYRVDASLVQPPCCLPAVEQPKTSPCIGKSEAECQAIDADFETRRKQIEAKWAEKIKQGKQQFCGLSGGMDSKLCEESMAEMTKQRDAELKALEEEHKLARGS